MAETNTNETVEMTENQNETNPAAQGEQPADNAELTKLKADLAKQKAALDKATKEAADYKRALRQHQSAEEAKAEEEAEKWAAIQRERDELLKEKTIATASKKVFTFVQDEEVSTGIAEMLHGAEDIEGAIDAIAKAWTAREKALRLEFGKIPAPGVGGTDGPTITKAQLESMSYTDRVDFAAKHPEEYAKLKGRA